MRELGVAQQVRSRRHQKKKLLMHRLMKAQCVKGGGADQQYSRPDLDHSSVKKSSKTAKMKIEKNLKDFFTTYVN